MFKSDSLIKIKIEIIKLGNEFQVDSGECKKQISAFQNIFATDN